MKWSRVMILLCWLAGNSFFTAGVLGQEYYDSSQGLLDAENYDEAPYSADTISTTRQYIRYYMDAAVLDSLRKQKEFIYKDLDTLVVPKKKAEEIRSTGIDANILLWLVVAVAVIIAALQLSGINVRQLVISGNNRGQEEQVSQNIHELEYEQAIKAALENKDFSLATKLMYLQSLKLLSDKQLIAWYPNKTNWQYVYELNNETLRNKFRNITYIFEYVEYGHMPITLEKFQVVQQSFDDFKTHIA